MTGPVLTPTASGIAADIAAVEAALAEARRQAEDGATIDLSGLETRVASLCTAVAALPAGAARVLRGPLGDLVAALAPLADALAAQHARRGDAIAAAIDGRSDPHTARHRASAAYGRNPQAAPPAPPYQPSHAPPHSTDEPT